MMVDGMYSKANPSGKLEIRLEELQLRLVFLPSHLILQ